MMEKVGVSSEILHEELRNEEAQLMQGLQRIMSDPSKTASDRTQIELRLQQVRNKLTELDLKNTSQQG